MRANTAVAEKYYDTSRIGEAAFLVVKGHTVTIECRGNMFVWLVPDSAKLRADVELYAKDAMVPVRTYNEAIKRLRSELQQLKREG